MKMEDVDTSPKTQKKQASNVVREVKETKTKNNEIQQLDGNYHTIKGLPSKGKFYPNDVEIKARPLKVIEVKKLSSITEDNADDVVNDILRRTVIGINVDDLLLADKLFIVFWLRANSYRDSSYKVGFVCEKCKEESTYHFELDNLDINYIDDGYDPNKEIILKQSNDKILLRFLTISDERYMSKFVEQNKNTMEVDAELLGLSMMIDTINGESKDLLSKYSYVLDLDPGDFSQLSTIISDNSMGLEPWLNVKCEKCGGESHIGITFHSDFFIPKFVS